MQICRARRVCRRWIRTFKTCSFRAWSHFPSAPAIPGAFPICPTECPWVSPSLGSNILIILLGHPSKTTESIFDATGASLCDTDGFQTKLHMLWRIVTSTAMDRECEDAWKRLQLSPTWPFKSVWRELLGWHVHCYCLPVRYKCAGILNACDWSAQEFLPSRGAS